MIDADQVLPAPMPIAVSGIPKKVWVIVNFVGTDAQKSDLSKYIVTFSGNGVDSSNGDIDCPGESGTDHPQNRYHITFTASVVEGGALSEATFEKPEAPPGTFEFKAGTGVCGDIADPSEIDEIKLVAGGRRVQIRNKKKNSNATLGYHFRIWVTHKSDGTQWGVPVDPRIINN